MVENDETSGEGVCSVSGAPSMNNLAREIKRLHGKAIELHREGHTQPALKVLRRAMLAAPEDFRVVADFFTLSRIAGDSVKCSVWASRVLVHLPDHLPALREHGLKLLDHREWRVAARVWRRTLLCEPRKGNDWVSLARAALVSQGMDDCLMYLRWAQSTNPSSVSIGFALGSALFNARRFVEAEDQMRMVIEVAGDDPKTQFWMGRILHAQGRRVEAKQYLSNAAESGAEMARFTKMIEATVLASNFLNR